MPQDAFHIRRLSKELDTFLVGGKINRVSQANKDDLTFIIYTKKTTVKLLLSTNASGARVCLTQIEKEPAPVAPNFCMLLRKHLLGAEIVSIKQHEFERIIEITLFCKSDFSESTRVLHCELMGKYSNLVLTENGVILGALKTTALEDSTRRILFAGAKYEYPVPQEKLSPFDRAGMRRIIENYLSTRTEGADKEGLAVFLFENVAGLALPTAREIVKRAGTTPLWDFVGEFCENEPCAPCVRFVGGAPNDFFAFDVDGGEKMPSLCKAEDVFFTLKESKKGFEDKKRKLENTARALKKKQAKKLQDTMERLAEADKAEIYRIKGELLTANLYKIEKGMTGIELENWYSPDMEKIKIALDATLPPSKNAQKYFKTYNKHKRAKEVLTPILQREQEEIAYTDSVIASVQLAESAEDLKEIEAELTQMGLLRAPKERVGAKRKEMIVPFREFEHDGFRILAGRNNLQNDRLLRQADPDDIWLHTQKYHSSHVIICTGGRQVRDETIGYAAEICAYYSDGQGGDKIPVDYCKRKFVKKPNKSKAGFVTYTDYKTVLVTPKKHEIFVRGIDNADD
ncbi:MAG: NFACT family protein [Clostridia bacterium]|nr:NFACT family protein [Clostridia bacterium]